MNSTEDVSLENEETEAVCYSCEKKKKEERSKKFILLTETEDYVENYMDIIDQFHKMEDKDQTKESSKVEEVKTETTPEEKEMKSEKKPLRKVSIMRAFIELTLVILFFAFSLRMMDDIRPITHLKMLYNNSSLLSMMKNFEKPMECKILAIKINFDPKDHTKFAFAGSTSNKSIKNQIFNISPRTNEYLINEDGDVINKIQAADEKQIYIVVNKDVRSSRDQLGKVVDHVRGEFDHYYQLSPEQKNVFNWPRNIFDR